jgi:hypothetical protein
MFIGLKILLVRCCMYMFGLLEKVLKIRGDGRCRLTVRPLRYIYTPPFL